MKYPKEKCEDYEWVNSTYCDLMPQILSSPDPNTALASLEAWRRKLFFITSAIFDTLSSGLHGYLIGPNGEDFEHAFNTAVEIGATDFAGSLSSLRKLFPESHIPSNEEEIFFATDEILKKKEINRLDDLIEITIDGDIWKRIRSLQRS